MSSRWVKVCKVTDVPKNSGVCVLLENNPIALFRTEESDAIYAVGNYDPIGDANVLSRGIMTDIDGRWMIASPLYKHHYCLKTGVCFEDDGISIPVYPAQVNSGVVELKSMPKSLEQSEVLEEMA